MNYGICQIDEKCRDKRLYVLIIYDIVEDARRRKLVKFLQGYGIRVQKSAFEAKINKKLYHKLLVELPKYVGEDDNIRVYKLNDNNKVVNFGVDNNIELDQVIIA